MLPEVGRSYTLTAEPSGRAIGGASSGAICAFTVAWNRPDQFRNVISFIGSYTSIGYRPAANGQPMQPGGDLYPTLIRKTPIKPLKVFLQDGSGDLLIRNVQLDVWVGEDGSGDIIVEDVRGDFQVDLDSSGSISYRNIGGRVFIPR